MKNLIFILCTFCFLSTKAQYSNYYTIDINQNVNKKVDVSGNLNINKNISTIDYGQLALANAQREKNRLENLKYADERERTISLEVASDPTKAFDYGNQYIQAFKGQDAKFWGFKKFTISYRIPHKSLFVQAGIGTYENISSDGITTEIKFGGPTYNKENQTINQKILEEYCNNNNIKVGAINENLGWNNKTGFVHKKDVNRATVYGVSGFKSTLIWEDAYEYIITDNYDSFDESIGFGILYSVQVRTHGDKDEITFEQLEGRRYYLKQLIEKVISTATCTDIKY